MKQEPSVEGLLELLHDLQQIELFNQLEQHPRFLMRWKQRTEAQWEKFYGIAGIDIYNYLHPRSEGI